MAARSKSVEAPPDDTAAAAACASSNDHATHYLGPRRMSLEPRRDQYQRHSLLQQRTIGGLSELEAVLIEETRRRKSSSGGLQPRTMQYENNPLFERNESGLTEFEACLIERDKERRGNGGGGKHALNNYEETRSTSPSSSAICNSSQMSDNGAGHSSWQAVDEGASSCYDKQQPQQPQQQQQLQSASSCKDNCKSVRFTSDQSGHDDGAAKEDGTIGEFSDKSCRSKSGIARLLRRQSAPEDEKKSPNPGKRAEKYALSDDRETDNGDTSTRTKLIDNREAMKADDNANNAVSKVAANDKLRRDASCVVC